MKSVMAFLKDLFGTPNNFAGDPYGYVTNQAGHFLLGFCLCSSGAWSCMTFTGHYLDQFAVFGVVVIGYFVAWELTVQGWRGLDTIEDVAFVALGAAPWLLIDMQYVLDRVFLFVLALAAALGAGAYRRWVRQ